MKSKPLIKGDFVSFKDYPLSKEYVFIWDVVVSENQEEFIVNVPVELRKENRYKRVEDKSKHCLFSTYEYAYVKGYDLIRNKTDKLGDDYEYLKLAIEMRRPTVFVAELLFLNILQSIRDNYTIDEMLVGLFTTIINDKYSILPEDEIAYFKDNNKITSEVRRILFPILFRRKCFWLIKRLKNFSVIAETIITEDGRSALLRMTEDRSLLKSLLTLLNQKENYKTATYSPLDTKTSKPISHPLNHSFYKLFQIELEDFAKSEEFKKKWFEEMKEDKILGQLNLENAEECFLSGHFPEFQKLLFSELGVEIPIRKQIKGSWSLDYNLALYIPIFKWLMPDIFTDRMPHMNESDLRKYHIRKIKDFIEGKI